MKNLSLIIPTLLLVLLALLAGSACSIGNGSKIGKEDADTLNQANANMITLQGQLLPKLQKCPKASNPGACRKKLLASYMDQMLSAADTYDQIAGNASGDCGPAIHTMARDIRSLANAVAKGSPMKSAEQLVGDEDAMFSACKLKSVSP